MFKNFWDVAIQFASEGDKITLERLRRGNLTYYLVPALSPIWIPLGIALFILLKVIAICRGMAKISHILAGKSRRD